MRMPANVFLLRYSIALAQGAEPVTLAALATEFTDAVDAAASDAGAPVLVSSEGFSALFLRGDEVFLGALEALAARRPVHVAYYVRPQDTALEARWREWGFRTKLEPSAWVDEQREELHYRRTVEVVRELAPSVRFDVRLFRPDLLPGGDVVADFTSGYLGIDGAPPLDLPNQNPGIPIDLVNLLRAAPSFVLGPEAQDEGGWRQGDLGPIVQRWGVPDSDAAVEARAVLRRYAHQEFEAENRLLLADLGAPTDHLVAEPPADRPAAPADELLARLDELWAPAVLEPSASYLFAALDELLGRKP
jgi:hypothetical protein